MSDLSGLNPTPHAIAVYASQPLSPGVTQHSLPSGRCPLLAPDFHRLDRTSLPGALIRSPRRRATGSIPEGGFQIDRELEARRQFEWQVGRLGAFEDAVGEPGSAIEYRIFIGAVGHQAPIMGEAGVFVDGGKAVLVAYCMTRWRLRLVRMSVTIRIASGGV